MTPQYILKPKTVSGKNLRTIDPDLKTKSIKASNNGSSKENQNIIDLAKE